MLHWRKRLGNWAALIRSKHGRVSWLAMLRALSTGPVPREVWNERIRICARCPIRTPGAWVCHRELADGRVIGCGCDLVFTCLAAAPYREGCWAQMKGIQTEGWMAHKFGSRRAKLWAFVKFFCGR